jgi:prolyl-tRNA synthetase
LLVQLGEKLDVNVADIGTTIKNLLDEIHNSLFQKAKAGRDAKVVQVTKWEDFVPALEQQCMVLTPFCDESEWEDKVKVRIKINIFTLS